MTVVSETVRCAGSGVRRYTAAGCRVPTPAALETLAGANADRAQKAAQTWVVEALQALEAIRVAAPNMAGPRGISVRQWVKVLEVRAANDGASLRELAALMTPPMTKNAYAAALRRACAFGARVADRQGDDGGRTRSGRGPEREVPQREGASYV